MDVFRPALASIRGLAAWTLLLAAGGCSMFGAQKMPQDEFAIETNRPLVLPPSYDLKPPQPGKPQEGPPASAAAQQTIYGQGSGAVQAAPAASTPGEANLLQRAGAPQANPDIRQQVNSETAPVSDRGPGMTDRVLGWHPPSNTQQGGAPASGPPAVGGNVGAGPPQDTTAPAGVASGSTPPGTPDSTGYTAPAEIQ